MSRTATVILVVELAALLVGVAFAIELLQRRLGAERLRRWMGGRPVAAALKGIALGFVTPFCTYSAIPLLIGLRRAGVTPAGYVAFIVAAPVLDPVLFGALVLIVGIEVALIYVTVAFSAALGLALIAERSGLERHLAPVDDRVRVSAGPPQDADTPPGSCAATTETAWTGWPDGAKGAARQAFTLLRSVWWLILIGVGIGLLIEAAVSPETAADLTGRAGWGAIPFAALVGTPLYFSTELFVPIADSLRSVGVASGPIVALTIAGAGANVPEFVILSRVAKWRVLAVFIAYVFAVAVVGGLLTAAIS